MSGYRRTRLHAAPPSGRTRAAMERAGRLQVAGQPYARRRQDAARGLGEAAGPLRGTFPPRPASS